MTLWSTALGHQMPLLRGYVWLWTASIAFCRMSSWPYIVLITRCLYGGYIWLWSAFSIAFCRMSSWPYIVLILTTRCLYWRYVSSVILNSFWVRVLHHRGLFYKRPKIQVTLLIKYICIFRTNTIAFLHTFHKIHIVNFLTHIHVWRTTLCLAVLPWLSGKRTFQWALCLLFSEESF